MPSHCQTKHDWIFLAFLVIFQSEGERGTWYRQVNFPINGYVFTKVRLNK